jgi:hypothetical protein
VTATAVDCCACVEAAAVNVTAPLAAVVSCTQPNGVARETVLVVS